MTAKPTETKTTLWRFLLARAQEPSSWRGAILMISGVVGISLDSALTLHIISVGVSIAGLIGVLTADREDPPAPASPAE